MPLLLNYMIYKFLVRASIALGVILVLTLLGVGVNMIAFSISFLITSYVVDGILGNSVLVFNDDSFRLWFKQYYEAKDELGKLISYYENSADDPNKERNLQELQQVKKELEETYQDVVQRLKEKQ